MERHAPAGGDEVTLEEFARMPEQDAYRLELVRGRVVREPRPGARHGHLLLALGSELRRFANEQGLGVVVADVGVRLPTEPPTVRGPDLAFVARKRVPARGVPDGFLEAAPDLAVEIVSPANTATEIQDKVVDYLEAGSRAVWVLDPGPHRVTVHHARDDVRILTAAAGDILDGGDVLPGFRLALSELFES